MSKDLPVNFTVIIDSGGECRISSRANCLSLCGESRQTALLATEDTAKLALFSILPYSLICMGYSFTKQAAKLWDITNMCLRC